MVDTVRTLAEMQVLLADNVTITHFMMDIIGHIR